MPVFSIIFIATRSTNTRETKDFYVLDIDLRYGRSYIYYELNIAEFFNRSAPPKKNKYENEWVPEGGMRSIIHHTRQNTHHLP